MAKRILCVDDDPDILLSLDHMLKSEGFKVLTADSPSNIFDIIQKFKPDLVLLDIYMGQYNGLEICKAMRSYLRTEKTPVLIITSDTDVDNAVSDFGATDMLLKPFKTDELIDKINSYLNPSFSNSN